MNETPKRPGPAEDPDATDTAVQPAANEPTEQPAEQPAATSPKKNRLAWVSSPKVAAATVITVLALGSLGGAFALGRATAPDPDGRMILRVPAGFEGQGGFDGQVWEHQRGPGFRQRSYEGEIEQAPDPDQSEVTPSPSQSS